MSVAADTDGVIPGVFKVGPNNYEFRANEPGAKGRQVRRRGFPTQDAAYRARTLYLAGTIKNPGANLTVGQWFADFRHANEGVWRPTTAANYLYAESTLIKLVGDILLHELEETAIRKAYADLVGGGYSTETILTLHRKLRTCLRQAVRERKIDRCPADNVRPPKGKPPKVHTIWSFEQLMAFAQFVRSERDGVMWALWMTTGLRRGEVCGLKWPKVTTQTGELVIDWQRTRTADNTIVEGPVKTDDGERIVPINERVLSGLSEWKAAQAAIRLAKGERWAGGDYVFTSTRNRPYYPGSLNQRLDVLTKRAGLPRLRPHELRHTYGTRAAESGMDIKVLSTMMGHSRVEITLNLYVHPATKQLHDAQDALASRMLG